MNCVFGLEQNANLIFDIKTAPSKTRKQTPRKSGFDLFQERDFTSYSLRWGSSDSSDRSLFESQNETMRVSGEISLFRAVIMQALLDSVSRSNRTEDKVAKQNAIRWFNLENPDFRFVCEIANWNKNWVFERSVIAIAAGCKWRMDSKKSVYSTNNMCKTDVSSDTINDKKYNVSDTVQYISKKMLNLTPLENSTQSNVVKKSFQMSFNMKNKFVANGVYSGIDCVFKTMESCRLFLS